MIDDQVVSILMQLKPPADWRKGMTAAMGEMLGEQSIEERLAEIEPRSSGWTSGGTMASSPMRWTSWRSG